VNSKYPAILGQGFQNFDRHAYSLLFFPLVYTKVNISVNLGVYEEEYIQKFSVVTDKFITYSSLLRPVLGMWYPRSWLTAALLHKVLVNA
jgi:hypothetical protein